MWPPGLPPGTPPPRPAPGAVLAPSPLPGRPVALRPAPARRCPAPEAALVASEVPLATARLASGWWVSKGPRAAWLSELSRSALDGCDHKGWRGFWELTRPGLRNVDLVGLLPPESTFEHHLKGMWGLSFNSPKVSSQRKLSTSSILPLLTSSKTFRTPYKPAILGGGPAREASPPHDPTRQS